MRNIRVHRSLSKERRSKRLCSKPEIIGPRYPGDLGSHISAARNPFIGTVQQLNFKHLSHVQTCYIYSIYICTYVCACIYVCICILIFIYLYNIYMSIPSVCVFVVNIYIYILIHLCICIFIDRYIDR